MMEQSACKISIQHLYKHYLVESAQQLTVLEDTHLDIQAGGFYSFIGQAGCGKSTLLRLIVGLESYQQGQILIDGIEHRHQFKTLSVVYANDRLFPWQTVRENIRMALQHSNLTKEEENLRIQAQLELLDLDHFQEAYPSQLSAAMNLKVSIAKSLVKQPDLLLLDEPFSALDVLMRQYLLDELRRIIQLRPITVILMTENVTDALQLSSHIVLMQQHGKIGKIFELPYAFPRHSEHRAFQQLKKDIFALLKPFTASV